MKYIKKYIINIRITIKFILQLSKFYRIIIYYLYLKLNRLKELRIN